jgi:CO dehydrogenase maturation factor
VGVSGKGGTGKTTFSALLVRHLTEAGHNPVLAIDADPNSCLAANLGTEPENSIGGIREELMNVKDELSPGLSKAQFIEMKVRTSMAEEECFDLLEMGRPEGPGCYCYVNSVLRTFMDNLDEGYTYVVMDNEAGLEHLSRRTTHDVDLLFLITDRSRIGIESAARVRDLAREMDLEIKNFRLVINRTGDRGSVEEVAAEFGFDDFDVIPFDPALEEAALAGKSVLELPASSPAVKAVYDIAKHWVPGF